MRKQGHLFIDAPATKRNDPVTSYMAEDFVKKSEINVKHTILVTRTVSEYPGLTSHELAKYIPSLTTEQCWKRIGDAKRNGWIKAIGHRKCNVRKSNRLCEIYGPV